MLSALNLNIKSLLGTGTGQYHYLGKLLLLDPTDEIFKERIPLAHNQTRSQLQNDLRFFFGEVQLTGGHELVRLDIQGIPPNHGQNGWMVDAGQKSWLEAGQQDINGQLANIANGDGGLK